ncbi:hypothetical protein B0J17DRAFT_674568 [Rhizoctonia solani]|nr:hypothetical protein B0J17DRAFT_674568 [Rhizoctonia solani]
MRWSQNYSLALVSTHKLPSEILAYIFLLVANLQSGSDWSGGPEVLTQVCSRWREIALRIPSLWRFIDLPFTGSVDTPQINRATFFASHAHRSRLYIRLNSNPVPTTDVLEYPRALVDIVAPHIHSLDVTSVTAHDLMDRYQSSFMAAYFARCTSGALKTLTISHSGDPILFNVATDLPGYVGSRCMIFSTGNLDHILASVTVLRIRGAYPIWTSKAYHGLVELRLSQGGTSHGGISISEKHLRGMLEASPALRILEYSIAIVEEIPLSSSPTPVPLNHLESLNVMKMPSAQLGTFWRLLAPGSKPLQLAMRDDDRAFLQLLESDEGRSFFARSNVTSIYAKSLGVSSLSLLPHLCPCLKTLAWDGARLALIGRWSMLEKQLDSCIPHTHLETLFILGGFVNDDALLKLIVKLPALSRLSFWMTTTYFPEFRRVHMNDISDLVSVYPHVEIVDNNPTLDWEVFH